MIKKLFVEIILIYSIMCSQYILDAFSHRFQFSTDLLSYCF